MKEGALQLEVLTPQVDLSKPIEEETISSPGLVLAGYTERFAAGRLQVLGETEISYLGSLSADALHRVLTGFLALEFPAIIVTKSLDVPPLLITLATEAGVPVLRTKLKTGEFYRRIRPYLEEYFAPTLTLHGSLADVYGVGLLFLGRSGIGKSECVLDL